jgi:hypothetical protein
MEPPARPGATQTDFYAEDFDAVAALNDPSLRPPRNIKPLPTFRDCRYLLPPSHVDYLNKQQEEHLRLERQRKRAEQAFRVVKPVTAALRRRFSWSSPSPLAKGGSSKRARSVGATGAGCQGHHHELSERLEVWTGAGASARPHELQIHCGGFVQCVCFSNSCR